MVVLEQNETPADTERGERSESHAKHGVRCEVEGKRHEGLHGVRAKRGVRAWSGKEGCPAGTG